MHDQHVIVAGDSNALGFLNSGPAPYIPTAQVQIWARQPDGSYAWNYMDPGRNTGTPDNPADWGPEVQLANDWLKLHAGDGSYLWIVKDDLTVKGGTTLGADWLPGAPFFASTAEAAAAAMHNLDGTAYSFDHYQVADVVLGENDAEVTAFAQAYGLNLSLFVPSAEQAWGVQHIVISRIEDTMGALADNQAVRDAQWLIPQEDPSVISFKTIGFEQQPDLVHYDAAGQVQLGDAFWNAGYSAGWII